MDCSVPEIENSRIAPSSRVSGHSTGTEPEPATFSVAPPLTVIEPVADVTSLQLFANASVAVSVTVTAGSPALLETEFTSKVPAPETVNVEFAAKLGRISIVIVLPSSASLSVQKVTFP